MSDQAVLQWQWMKGSDFPDVERHRTVVFVTASPLEVHGPHLPVVADNLESEALARRTFELLVERLPELRVLRLPPLFVASDTLPQAGSLEFRPSTVIRVVSDLGRSLSRQGFRHLWVGNFHGGPRHFLALETACARINRRYGMRSVSIFSALLNRLTRGSMQMGEVLGQVEGLTSEVLDGDTHAGAIETSLLLHLAPDRVALGHDRLPPRTLKRVLEERGASAVKQGGGRFGETVRWLAETLHYYATETYAGSPGAGRAQIGAELLELFSSLAADALADVWTGRLHPDRCRTPLYRYRAILLNPAVRWAAERLIGVRNGVF